MSSSLILSSNSKNQRSHDIRSHDIRSDHMTLYELICAHFYVFSIGLLTLIRVLILPGREMNPIFSESVEMVPKQQSRQQTIKYTIKPLMLTCY